MAPQTLTEYERERLENIKRNGEMMASLKLHSRVQQLSSSVTKRKGVEAKGYKVTQLKKPKPESPVVLRRSLRNRQIKPETPVEHRQSLRTGGTPSDYSSPGGVEDDLVVSTNKTYRSPVQSKPSPRVLGPFSMRDAYSSDSSDRPFINTIKSISENTPLSFSMKKQPFSINGDRNSHGAMITENDPFSCSIKKEFEGDLEKTPFNDSMKRELDQNGASYTTVMDISEKTHLSSLNLASLRLKPENIARVVPGRIFNLCFFPTTYRLIVIAGNKFGNIGFWDVDSQEKEGNGIYLYHPHSAPVSGILIRPYSLSKVFTSCYNGFIRLLDVERESFDLVYSSKDPIFSLSQRPHDAKSLYFGEGQGGGLNVWDERAGKSSSSCMLHEQRINSIDFNPENNNLMATSSTDGTACIWDVRSINANKPKSLTIVDHERAVHSAYFSPSGNCLATTSVSDKVGVLGGVDFADVAMIHHNNQTGRWISPFRAIWGWDDSYLFVGNMGRGVDVISTTHRRTVMTLESPHLTAIPCRFATHPYKVGMLAGATGGGQVYIWTSS